MKKKPMPVKKGTLTPAMASKIRAKAERILGAGI